MEKKKERKSIQREAGETLYENKTKGTLGGYILKSQTLACMRYYYLLLDSMTF
jgi:hypothetical protein